MSLNDYVAGAIGGCAGLAVGHPFDTTKVQMQTQQGASAYKGTWDAVKSIHQHGWAKGFFRGLAFPLASYGVVNSIFFGVYGNTLRALNRSDDPFKQPTYGDVFVAGCVGGCAQLIPACPIDVVKVVLQSQISHNTGTRSPLTGLPSQRHFFNGPFQCIRTIYHNEGLRGLYRGLGPMALRDIPASISYFVTYEYLFAKIHQWDCTDKKGMMASMLAGGSAGTISWLIVMPCDVIKSKLQADYQKVQYKGLIDCVRKIYASQGLNGFFRGMTVALLRAFPVNAVTFLVYSQSLRLMNEAKHIVETFETPEPLIAHNYLYLMDVFGS